MYSKCVSCDFLGNQCTGPNFLAMDPPEVIDWCRQRKKYLGISNDKIAQICHTPKGTVDRVLSGGYDYKYSTIRPIAQALIGENWGEHPCPTSDDTLRELDSLRTQYDHACQRLENLDAQHRADVQQLQDEHRRKIDHLNAEIATLREELVFKRQQLRSAHTGRIVMTAVAIASLIASLLFFALL